MKKTVLTLLILLAMVFVSCNEDVGIIGGADGPTAITVGKTSNK